jgi:hypothetical protein
MQADGAAYKSVVETIDPTTATTRSQKLTTRHSGLRKSGDPSSNAAAAINIAMGKCVTAPWNSVTVKGIHFLSDCSLRGAKANPRMHRLRRKRLL